MTKIYKMKTHSIKGPTIEKDTIEIATRHIGSGCIIVRGLNEKV